MKSRVEIKMNSAVISRSVSWHIFPFFYHHHRHHHHQRSNNNDTTIIIFIIIIFDLCFRKLARLNTNHILKATYQSPFPADDFRVTLKHNNVNDPWLLIKNVHLLTSSSNYCFVCFTSFFIYFMLLREIK